MTKKSFKTILPYAIVGILVLGIVFVGSRDKNDREVSLSLDTFAATNYDVSTDQLTELYVVADLSSAMSLASAETAASNFVTIDTLHAAGQISTDKLEKPNIVYVTTRGVISYTVQPGDTMATIAKKYKLTTTQIRWSNGLKTEAISAGATLYLPSTPGIVYTVKSGDTIDSIVSKYGSNATEIIALNDLEVSGIATGMRIVIKNGTLPETERPEYVAPRRTYSYSSLGSTSKRQNIQVVSSYFYDRNYPYPNPNPGVPGWCTWYAWWWRATSPDSLGVLGHEGRNANTWHRNYAYRGVGKTPRKGAVFQTPYGGGGYGHVGVVVRVNDDGSIVVREMNYAGRYVVTEATIPASQVGNFNYIY